MSIDYTFRARRVSQLQAKGSVYERTEGGIRYYVTHLSLANEPWTRVKRHGGQVYHIPGHLTTAEAIVAVTGLGDITLKLQQ